MFQNRTNVEVLEETLDPEDWEALRALGHQMVDDMVDYIKTVRERPIWRHAPTHIKTHFNEPLPQEPQAPEDIYEEFKEYVLPYPLGNIHPRFWGWVVGTGTVLGSLADFLAASMNSCSGALAYHGANYVELQVLDWIKEILGFPKTASGLLTSGCSASNLIGLTVARNTQPGLDLRQHGIQAVPQRMVLYASEEIHASVQRTVEMLGLGSSALRSLPVNDKFQVEIEALKLAIRHDREDGYLPFCVVGAAGTTNTGAVDDLNALADICEREGLWFHVDGAFGAWAVMADSTSDLVAGIKRADSVACDLHKWMYLPYEIGCVLVKCEEHQRYAFALEPAYLAHGDGNRGMTGHDVPWLTDYGFQYSRGFRALKAWMSLKVHGAAKFARLIQQNIDQAHYLAGLIEAVPELELLAPVSLNVVCFRFAKPDLSESVLDALNQEIVVGLQEQGIAVVSGTTLRGRYCIHMANTNHRSRLEDFDLLVREVIRIGNEAVEAS
jgi:glutamate/tyrosine decarboxylase-like PLP-dependent enzyme